MPKTWLITGCSTGFGKVLAEAVLARGDQVVATARNPASLDGFLDRYAGTVRTAALDVTKPDTAASAVVLAERSAALTSWSTTPATASWRQLRRGRPTSTARCSRPTCSA